MPTKDFKKLGLILEIQSVVEVHGTFAGVGLSQEHQNKGQTKLLCSKYLKPSSGDGEGIRNRIGKGTGCKWMVTLTECLDEQNDVCWCIRNVYVLDRVNCINVDFYLLLASSCVVFHART